VKILHLSAYADMPAAYAAFDGIRHMPVSSHEKSDFLVFYA